MYRYAVYTTLYCTSTAAAAFLAAPRRLSVGHALIGAAMLWREKKAAAVAEKSKQQQKK